MHCSMGKRLLKLRAAGITRLRIPVGWWAFESPASRTDDDSDAACVDGQQYTQPGMSRDGFVTGGTVYLKALLRWLPALGMDAVLDMHALPGGAVRNVGYTGVYFKQAQFFLGADAWFADLNVTSLPRRASDGGTGERGGKDG